MSEGLGLINALDEMQRRKAIIQVSKTGNNNVGERSRTIVLDYAGIRAAEKTAKQKEHDFRG